MVVSHSSTLLPPAWGAGQGATQIYIRRMNIPYEGKFNLKRLRLARQVLRWANIPYVGNFNLWRIQFVTITPLYAIGVAIIHILWGEPKLRNFVLTVPVLVSFMTLCGR